MPTCGRRGMRGPGPRRARLRRVGASLALGLLVAATGPLPSAATAELPGIQGADDRRPVITSGPSAGGDYPWPWQAIGRVNRNTGGFCTGTLIAPDLVLTAAHCLYNRRVGQLPPESLHFVAGYRFGSYDAHGRVASIHRPDVEGARGDFVVLRLRSALEGIRPLPLMALEALPGRGRSGGIHARVMLAGYSQDRPHLLALDDPCVVLGVVTDPLWRHDCDGPKGSSGGPVLMAPAGEEDSEPRVAGISIGFAPRGPMPRGVMVPVPVIRAYMEAEGLVN